jgi:hypothetical protein
MEVGQIIEKAGELDTGEYLYHPPRVLPILMLFSASFI